MERHQWSQVHTALWRNRSCPHFSKPMSHHQMLLHLLFAQLRRLPRRSYSHPLAPSPKKVSRELRVVATWGAPPRATKHFSGNADNIVSPATSRRFEVQ